LQRNHTVFKSKRTNKDSNSYRRILKIYFYLPALFLAGTELIFFIAACTLLCFGLTNHTVDSTGTFQLLLSSVRTASRPSLFFRPPRQRVGKRLGGDAARAADPNRPKGHPTLYEAQQ